jgi:hypothetical protein
MSTRKKKGSNLGGVRLKDSPAPSNAAIEAKLKTMAEQKAFESGRTEAIASLQAKLSAFADSLSEAERRALAPVLDVSEALDTEPAIEKEVVSVFFKPVQKAPETSVFMKPVQKALDHEISVFLKPVQRAPDISVFMKPVQVAPIIKPVRTKGKQKG